MGPLDSGEDVDVDTSEGGGLAAAAGLAGFELVEGLVELAVEVGLVADDLVEVGLFGDEALEKAPVDLLAGERLFSGYAEGPFAVGGGGGHGFGGAEGSADDGGFLEVDEAPELPEGQGDALGEMLFERAVGGQVANQAGAMAVPFLFGLVLGDDGRGGENGVSNGVVADGFLSGFGLWSAAGDGGPPWLVEGERLPVRSCRRVW